MDPRTGRSPARFLAPLALIVVIVAFLAIVSGSGNGGGGSSTGGSSATTTGSQTSKTGSKSSTGTSKTTAKKGPKIYIVKVGDTLGGIAAKTGVSLSQIQTLNPAVDPNSMVAGQRIKLR